MNRGITGFHQDAEGDWIAELECGHGQHVRHRPPWQLRPWVEDEASRRARMGTPLDCRLCDPPAEPLSPEEQAYRDARVQGLCHDGAREVARGARKRELS